MSEELPADIIAILEGLARWACGYNNHLKWNEEAKLKADLMHNRRRWQGFPVSAITVKRVALGMRDVDVALITDLVRRTQEGRRLVAHRSYRDFSFSHKV